MTASKTTLQPLATYVRESCSDADDAKCGTVVPYIAPKRGTVVP